MPLVRLRVTVALGSTLLAVPLLQAAVLAGPWTGQQASAEPVQLVRVTSGPSGTEQGGRFVIDEPRTTFSAATDTQVIVYFEWQATPGKHRFEGVWRNPAGEIEVITRFDYEAADKQFGGVYKLPLTSTMKTGRWTLEARVDGASAGSHVVEVLTDATLSPAVPHAPAKRSVSPAEAYRALAASVLKLEALDETGVAIGGGLGFVIPDVGLVTAFQVVDGATTVRVTGPDRRTYTIDRVVGLNRDADLAVLPAPTNELPPLALGTSRRDVGERVYSLSLGRDGVMTLLDTSVTGIGEGPGRSKRFALAHPSTRGAAGSPVVAEDGTIVGILGGVPYPGARTVRPDAMSSTTDYLGLPDFELACLPIDAFLAGERTPGPLADLLRQGIATRPLGLVRRHVASGLAAQGAQQERGWLRAVGQNSTFSRKAGTFSFVVTLSALEKLRSTGMFRLFDIEGRALLDSKALKIGLGQGDTSQAQWKVDASRLAEGPYRVDFLLDGIPAWRMFVVIGP